MRNLILCFLSLFVFSSMTKGQSTSLFDKLIFKNGDQTLPYRLLKPVNPGVKEKFPLVIFLHGAGERGTDNEAQITHIKDLFLDSRNRGKYPCYVLAPQCPKGVMWAEHNKDGSLKEDPTPTMRLVMDLMEKITREFPIDEARIYITGVSMGGYGTWDLLARYPETFAAAVPICGGGDPGTASAIKHIPVWAFHGARDEVVSPKRSRVMVAAIQKAGGLPGYTEYPDIGHNSWVQAYQEPHLLPWLFKQKCSEATSHN